jgi:hypothetical protein
LQGAGSITDETRALSLNAAYTSAVNKNVSFNVVTLSGQILAGNANPQDKLDYLHHAYQQVLATGDVTAATTIQNEAYTLSQKIQYDAQTADTARQTLASANASGKANVATYLKGQLQLLNNSIQHVGQTGMNNAIQNWVQQNSKQLEALGVKLTPGAQPNYWDIVQGVGHAMTNAYNLAYTAELPVNPSTAEGYLVNAQKLAYGVDKLPTLAGDKNALDIQKFAQNPAASVPAYTNGVFNLKDSVQTGFNGYDQNGQPQQTYSGSIKQTVFLTAQQTMQMHQLGLQFTENKSKTTGNGVEVQVGPNSPGWIKSILGPNGVTNMFTTGQGLQFEAGTKSGLGYYTIAQDSKGLMAPYLHTQDGKVTALAGQYGFNQKVNTIVSNATVQQLQVNQKIQQAQAASKNMLASNSTVMNKALLNLTAAGAHNAIRGSMTTAPTMTQRAGGGFNFSYQGQAISAARYSQLTGTQFRSLLGTMSNAGDTGAKAALGFVGNDFGYDPTKMSAYQNAGTYNALTWGAGVKSMSSAVPATAIGSGVKF